MKLPLAIATLALVVTTALPAVARTPAGRTFFQRDAERMESVQRGYQPARIHAARPTRQPLANGGAHCVTGLSDDALSGYPSWSVCAGS